METQLRELVPFLRDRNVQVRALALENLLPQTPQGSPYRKIFFAGLGGGGLQKSKENGADIVRDLKLLCRDQLNVAHDAFRALVNLSDSPLLVAPLSEPNFVGFLVSYIVNPHAILADLASMLLSNLTSSSAACSVLLNLKISIVPDSRLPLGLFPIDSRCASCPTPVPYPSAEPQQVSALPLLVDAFVHGASAGDIQDISKRPRKSQLHFLANVFANITISPVGRSWFLSPQTANILKPTGGLEYPLAKLVTFTEHKDRIRRGGVASTIKNCAFLAAGHKAMLSPESERTSVPPSTVTAPGIDVLPYILLPLAGPEELDLEDQDKLLEPLQFLPADKKRETDPAIRLTHVETLLLLCHTRWGRDYLRAHGAYEIIRETHKSESVDKVAEHIVRLVRLIHGDEPKESLPESEDIMLIDKTLSGASFTRAPFATVSASKSTQNQKAPQLDEVDEDDRIEEV